MPNRPEPDTLTSILREQELRIRILERYRMRPAQGTGCIQFVDGEGYQLQISGQPDNAAACTDAGLYVSPASQSSALRYFRASASFLTVPMDETPTLVSFDNFDGCGVEDPTPFTSILLDNTIWRFDVCIEDVSETSPTVGNLNADFKGNCAQGRGIPANQALYGFFFMYGGFPVQLEDGVCTPDFSVLLTLFSADADMLVNVTAHGSEVALCRSSCAE